MGGGVCTQGPWLHITHSPFLLYRSALDSIVMKIWSLCQKVVPATSKDTLNYSTTSSNISNSTSNNISNTTSINSKLKTSRSSLYEGVRLRIESVSWFFISLVLAIFVPQISYIISLTGGLAASFIFLFPGFILLRLMLKPGTEVIRNERCKIPLIVFGCLIIILGTFIFGLSIVYTIMNDANLLGK